MLKYLEEYTNEELEYLVHELQQFAAKTVAALDEADSMELPQNVRRKTTLRKSQIPISKPQP